MFSFSFFMLQRTLLALFSFYSVAYVCSSIYPLIYYISFCHNDFFLNRCLLRKIYTFPYFQLNYFKTDLKDYVFHVYFVLFCDLKKKFVESFWHLPQTHKIIYVYTYKTHRHHITCHLLKWIFLFIMANSWRNE